MADEVEERESFARSHLPYVAEYCKTSRARCHRCSNIMHQDSLKLATSVKSPFHDGFLYHFNHVDCFFQIKRPESVAEIRNFELLRYEDQKIIEKAIDTKGLSICGNGDAEQDDNGENIDRKPKSKRCPTDDQFANYHDFVLEYAKTGRAQCNLCNIKIEKNSVRLGKLDYEYEASWAASGPITRWFHAECFNKSTEQLEFYGNVERIDSFKELDEEDQKMLKKTVKPPKQTKLSAAVNKKVKVEANNNEDEDSCEEDRLLKEQSDRFFQLREQVNKMKLDDVRSLMSSMGQKNNFKISSVLIDHATDVLLFGPIQRCPECKKTGGMQLRGSSYICTQSLEWGTCTYETREPKRDMPNIPESILERYPWFKTDYWFIVRKRIFPSKLIRAIESKEAELNADVQDEAPLDGLTIGVSSWGALKHGRTGVQKKVTMLGGKLTTVLDRTVFVILSNTQDYESESPKIEVAKSLDIPFAKDDFLYAIETKSDVVKSLSKSLLHDWKGNLEERFTNMNVNQLKHNIKSRSQAHQAKRVYKSGSVAKSQAIVVKDGTAVDPESNLVEVGRVYRQGPCIYNVVLNNVDVSKDKNSFYKIQIIEHEQRREYHIFRAWGRIGCGIGGNLVREADSLESAKEEFETLFKERTGNLFSDYTNGSFRKIHGLYYPVDVDYSDQSMSEVVKLEYDADSSLERAVQELICFIFDIQRMRSAMKRFELDAEKMPLGKLSERHILDAMRTLKELEITLDVKPPKRPNKKRLTMLTNKFYTLIPHTFGDGSVELINSLQQVNEKNQMLAELKEIEVAYKMSLSIKNDTANVPVDQYYMKLSCSIKVLNPDDIAYKMIAEYVSLNHATTHNNYALEIQQIFQISRESDMKRFKKHKKKARALLWHGSSVTNFAGILSQGLRIAPPEAPSTGFMFGKGVYFADMSSKAANYCLADPTNNRGLLLLCEVALGKAHELLESDADMPANLPKTCHSVKGLGKSIPNPETHREIEDNISVPIGKQKPNKGVKSQLLYNEYVVYDEAQTMIRYIVDTKFEFRS